MSASPSRQLLPVLGFAAAAALAAAAWLAPMPFLRPLDGPEPPPEPTPGNGAAAPAGAEAPRPDWTTLAALLEPLRDYVEPAPVEVAAPSDTEPGTSEPEPFNEWRYHALVQTPGRRAAIITTSSGSQRFVFEGETVKDPYNPSSEGITVVRIEPEKLFLQVEGREVVVPLVRPGGADDGSFRTVSSPSPALAPAGYDARRGRPQ